MKLTLTLMADTLAVCRLEPTMPVPAWALQVPFFSLTRTPEELSLVVSQACVPEEIVCEREWRALKIEGPLDFTLTGILVSVCAPLAEADISIFVISTY